MMLIQKVSNVVRQWTTKISLTALNAVKAYNVRTLKACFTTKEIYLKAIYIAWQDSMNFAFRPS